MTSQQYDDSTSLESRLGAGSPPYPAVRGPVNADLVYALTSEQRPYYYMCEPPPGQERLVGEYGARNVRLQDGREASEEFRLDVHGFALSQHSTALADAYDDAEVRRVYYPEVERLVLRAAGAARVLVFDHNVRSGPQAKAGRRGVNEPVRRVHNDYTVESALLRLQQLLPGEAEALAARRYAFINAWRPLFGPVLDTPLAMCDARGIDPHDLVTISLIYPDRVGENYNFAHSERHRWYYFSQMQADEVLLLKCMDGAADGRARFTAHTAFDDARAPADARPRESIEVRTIAFY
jgi:hypothetical protein